MTRDGNLGTVLVTGAGGYLASHIIDAFLASPECKKVTTASRSVKKYQHRPEGAENHICDITDPDQARKILDLVRPTVIVHTIAPPFFASNEEQYRVNYLATKRLLKLAKVHPTVRAFIYTSSMEGSTHSGFDTEPLTEFNSILYTLESGPTGYARTKGAAEALVLASNSRKKKTDRDFSGELRTTALRIPRLYGPRDNSMIPSLFNMVNTGGVKVQFGPNQAVHEFLYVESAANAHVQAAKALLIENPSENMRVDGETFNLSDGKPMKFWIFVQKLWASAGDPYWGKSEKASPIAVPWWLVFAMCWAVEWLYNIVSFGTKQPRITCHSFKFMREGCWWSIDKAKKRLEWEPACDTDEGIGRTVAWFEENREWSKSCEY